MFGKYFKKTLAVKGMSQSEFAKKSGFSVAYVNQVANNKRPPSKKFMTTCADLLGIPIIEIVQAVGLMQTESNRPDIQEAMQLLYALDKEQVEQVIKIIKTFYS